jgi:UDP-GlcNAc:undecaprenyl-phosphate GlcNAc-1-phosphate transferase
VAPVAVRIGRRWKLLDIPDERRHHVGAVPRTGGVAVVGGFAAGCLAAFALGAFPTMSGEAGGALPFVAATGIVFAVGLLDDVRGCSAGAKLLAQSVAAALIVAAGHGVEVVSTPFGAIEMWDGPLPAGWGASVVAVGWLVGITNALNLMDGLDGLAGGVASIIAGSLAVFAALHGDAVSFVIALVLCGACVGFLPYNWQPARIFLGDAGSLTIGFVLAWLSLTASLKASTAVAVFVPLLVLGVPAFDTLLVMRSRFMQNAERRLQSRVRRVFQGDRQHMHHLFLAVAEHRIVVLTVYALVALFCVLSLLAVFRSNLHLALATLVVELVVVILVRSVCMRRTIHAGLAGAPGTDITPASRP